MLCSECLVEMKSVRGGVECPSCGQALVPDAEEGKPRPRPGAPRPSVLARHKGLLIALSSAAIAVTASAGAIFFVFGDRILGENAADRAGRAETLAASEARDGIALQLPEGFRASTARIDGDRMFLLAQGAGGRRIFVFDAAGAKTNEIALPFSPDWAVESFAPVDAASVVVAGPHPDGVFVAQVSSPGQINWVRLEAGRSDGDTPLQVRTSLLETHLLFLGASGNGLTLASYSANGERRARRDLPDLATNLPVFLSVDELGDVIVAGTETSPPDANRPVRISLRGDAEIERTALAAPGSSVSAYAVTDAGSELALIEADGGRQLSVSRFGDTQIVRWPDGEAWQEALKLRAVGENVLAVPLVLGEQPQARLIDLGALTVQELDLPMAYPLDWEADSETAGGWVMLGLQDGPRLYRLESPSRSGAQPLQPVSAAGADRPEGEETVETEMPATEVAAAPSATEAPETPAPIVADALAEPAWAPEEAASQAEIIPDPPEAVAEPETSPSEDEPVAVEGSASAGAQEVAEADPESALIRYACTARCFPAGVPEASYPVDFVVEVAPDATFDAIKPLIKERAVAACSEFGSETAEIDPECRLTGE